MSESPHQYLSYCRKGPGSGMTGRTAPASTAHVPLGQREVQFRALTLKWGISQSNGDVVLGCTIPAIGKVQNLFVDVAFEWDSSARGSSGIGRSRDAVRFPLRSMAATDASKLCQFLSAPLKAS